MRIGMLTGGGDCPGLNAVIRAATRRLVDGGAEPIGVLRGWRGMIDGLFRPLDLETVSGILPRGGTILRTSRTNPFSEEGGVEAVKKSFEQLDGLIAIGGEDTLGVAARLHGELGLPVVGVPKTIDNDLAATDQTFGFDTAVSIASEAIDRLHTTAESHDRVIVVEVMGRHAGWLAVASGIAGGADVVLIPEFPLTVERCAELIKQRHARDKDFSIVVVSEGWPLTREEGAEELSTRTGEVDAFGHARLGGVGQQLADLLEQITGFETRVTTLGHLQRGGTPTAYDRILATRYGLLAAELALAEALRPDDGAARDRGRRGAARRGGQGAAHRPARVLRARRGVLRLIAERRRHRRLTARARPCRSARGGARARRAGTPSRGAGTCAGAGVPSRSPRAVATLASRSAISSRSARALARVAGSPTRSAISRRVRSSLLTGVKLMGVSRPLAQGLAGPCP